MTMNTVSPAFNIMEITKNDLNWSRVRWNPAKAEDWVNTLSQELYIGKVLADNGSGRLDWIVKGIDWDISQKVDIISMSLGCSMDPGPVFHDAFKSARSAGIVVVPANKEGIQSSK